MKYALKIAIISLTLPWMMGVEAFETDTHLIVNHPRHRAIYELSDTLKQSSSYEIEIYPDPHYRNAQPRNDGLEAGDVSGALHKANQLYHAQRYDEAISTLLNIYSYGEDNLRVNNMLGSLFYLQKNYSAAERYWTQSLKLNSDQKSIRQWLEKLPHGSEQEDKQ